MYKTILFRLLILSLLLIILPKEVYAKKIIFSDDFESGSTIDSWEVVRTMQWQNKNLPCMYFNEPAYWQIKDGEIGIEINGPGCVTEIIPKNFDLNGINNFEYSFDWNFKETIYADRNVIFLWKDQRNWYDFKITSNQILLQKVIDGVSLYVPNSQTSYAFEKDKKYHFIIQKKDDNISLFIDENKILYTTDSNPRIEGWKTLGLQASVGSISSSKSFFDNIVVYDLDAPDIKEAPLIKQNDPSWAEIEYDSANQWSTRPTIARWGCALTSMAMILKSHAISVMPGGEVVSPATLNQWLKQQPDGYLGNGLLNWLAVSRLTKQLNSILNTPALEYKKLNYSTGSLQDIISQIDGQKPVILELPGHFLVADNYTADKTDLLIKDPAYNFDKLSQHNQTPQSIRTFTPSQTDLSYILLAVDSTIEVQIEKPGGATQSADLDEYLTTTEENPEEKEQSPKIKIISLAKPELGEYLLKFNQKTFGPLKFTLFTYDKNGEVKDLSKQTHVGQTPIVYKLQFTQSKLDQITRESDFDTFRALVTELSKANQIQSPVVEIWLDYFAQIAQQNDIVQDKLRYINLLTETAKWYKNDLTVLAQTSLQEELISIKINLERL